MQAFLKRVASGTPSNSSTNELEKAVKKACDHVQWRQEYMTFLEQLEREREAGRAEGFSEGVSEGRAQERLNTERERKRADAAEKRIRELEQLLTDQGVTENRPLSRGRYNYESDLL